MHTVTVHGSRGDIMVDIITLAMAKAAMGGGSGGDMHITGNLQVDGNITQQGQSYETHAQKVYTKDDYIVTRDGAVSGLASDGFSGFQVKKYDGTNDGRLVVDSDGTARVGDVGDEQPLLTRAETADLVDGAPLVWDATNLKAISGSAGGGDWVKCNTIQDFIDCFDYVQSTSLTANKDILIRLKLSGAYLGNNIIYIPKGTDVYGCYIGTPSYYSFSGTNKPCLAYLYVFGIYMNNPSIACIELFSFDGADVELTNSTFIYNTKYEAYKK